LYNGSGNAKAAWNTLLCFKRLFFDEVGSHEASFSFTARCEVSFVTPYND
jgi:hypothetical protein